MLNLDSLSAVVSKDYSKEPDDYEAILYLFLDMGIDFNTFCELPIPYILSMLKVKRYMSKLQKEQMNKIK